MNEMTLTAHAQNLNNWMQMSKVPEHYPQFNRSTLKYLMSKRAERPGLARCARLIGKQLYVNIPLFGLYLGGQLPEQQVE